ncbi:MAG: DUF760 domain-containing protein [Spirulina sp. SIO3F2]|nr:DUF760 domain-containing protein [Spirulina sp. SIO3F2]
MDSDNFSTLGDRLDAAVNQNPLLQYLQTLGTEQTLHLSQPSPDALQVMEQQVVGTLGHLPNEQFEVNITTSREQLGRLLASAMVSGYFLHKAEQRLTLEQQWANPDEPTPAEAE